MCDLRRQRVQGVVLDVYPWDVPPARSGPPPAAAVLADPSVIRDLVDLADPEAALTPGQLGLARWVSEHYRAPLYEALADATFDTSRQTPAEIAEQIATSL